MVAGCGYIDKKDGITPDKKLLQLREQLEAGLKAASATPLPVTDDLKTDIGMAIELSSAAPKKAGAAKTLAELYGKNGEGLFKDDGHITIDRIINPKNDLPGAQVAMTHAPLDLRISPETDMLAKSLGNQLRPLEAKAEAMQKDYVKQERARRGMPPLPDDNWQKRVRSSAARSHNTTELG